MLGACGIYDLFWWSVLGEMLDYCENPASVFGIGLSANVLGVLLGGLIGKAVSSAQTRALNPTLLALAVVCVTLALLPPLHRRLCSLLKDHAYLAMFSEISPWEQSRLVRELAAYEGLSERERQVASLLLQRKTYKMIGEELFISENTVKYYVKNIYSKLGIRESGGANRYGIGDRGRCIPRQIKQRKRGLLRAPYPKRVGAFRSTPC